EAGAGVEQVHAVFLVDGLAPHDAPFVFAVDVALLEKIVEASGAQNVDALAVDVGSLADGHLGLGDCAFSLYLDANAAQKMQDGNAFFKAAAAYFNELGSRALKPGGRHPAVVMPDGGKAVPEARVAPDGPVLNDFGNLLPVQKLLIHACSPLINRSNGLCYIIGALQRTPHGHAQAAPFSNARRKAPWRRVNGENVLGCRTADGPCAPSAA